MNFLKSAQFLVLICIILSFQVLSIESKNTIISYNNFEINTADVARFKNLIDSWENKNQQQKLEMLEKQYLSAGSTGLNEFYRIKIRDKRKFIETLDKLYRYYQSLDIFNLDLTTLHPQLVKVFAQFSKWTDDAEPLDVYFVVGRLSSAGTVSDKGILIGTEHFSKNLPTTLVEQGYKLRSIDFLLSTIAHEYVHSLQHQAGPKTLIRAVIFEGGADFLAELSTGISPTTKPHYVYGLSHQKQVWHQFKKVINDNDVSDWIANRQKENWPADIGYFVGYQIAKHYYQNMGDKREAFKQLTHVSDPETILKISQYGDNY